MSTYRRDPLEELRQRLDGCDDPEERVDLLHRLADVHRSRGESTSAAAAWKEALEIEPDDRAALEGLRQIHREQGRWAELVDILDQLLVHAVNANAEVPLHREMARAKLHLGDVDGAIESHRSAILCVDDERDYRALKELLAQQGRWQDLLELLREWEMALASEELAPKLQMERAEILATHLGDVDRAVEEYEMTLSLGHRAAFPPLRALLVAHGRYEKLISALEDLAYGTDDQAEARKLHREIARVYREELGDEESARREEELADL